MNNSLAGEDIFWNSNYQLARPPLPHSGYTALLKVQKQVGPEGVGQWHSFLTHI